MISLDRVELYGIEGIMPSKAYLILSLGSGKTEVFTKFEQTSVFHASVVSNEKGHIDQTSFCE